MIRTLLTLSLALWLAACAEKPAAEPAGEPAGEPAAAGAAPDGDCNLSTPLVAGVPGSPGHLIVSERNPNGDSELAVLMRRFVDDLRDVRTTMEAGGSPDQPLLDTHRRMRCSWPTKPEERNEAFDARAQAYLAQVRAFDEAPSPATYNAIIHGCMSCHAVSCGGPLDFIESMLWD
jgi:hypothetical protein